GHAGDDAADGGSAAEVLADPGDDRRLPAGRVAEAERRQHGEEDAAALGEGTAGHWMISSARASTDGGMVRPSLWVTARTRGGVSAIGPYAILTFQKTGVANLRMPWTSLRKAVGATHSPHGTYVTSSRATFWISSASCFRFL